MDNRKTSHTLKLIFAFISLLMLLNLFPSQVFAGDLELRVMSFNIRYGSAGDGPNQWKNRKEMVFDVLRDHKPDIVGLQGDHGVGPRFLWRLDKNRPPRVFGIRRLGKGGCQSVDVFPHDLCGDQLILASLGRSGFGHCRHSGIGYPNDPEVIHIRVDNGFLGPSGSCLGYEYSWEG